MGGFEHALHARNRPHDVGVAELAELQHGVVAYAQLIELGLGRGAIQNRVGTGRLHPLHVGVFAVGHRRVSRNGRLMAAVLSCGPEALLSHRSAAQLWGILPNSSSRVDVAADRTKSGRPGVALHRVRLHAEDRAERDGIPITSIARTLLDLGQMATLQQLRRALDEAERLRLFDAVAMQQLIERSHGHRGLRTLRAALDAHHHDGPPPFTRSELERRFLEMCLAAGLPRPQVNSLIAGIEVDMAWRDRRLVVELDGHAVHRTPAAFERDRERDAVLQLAGYRVLRVTYRRLAAEPAVVLTQVQTLLSRSPERHGGAPGGGAPAHLGGPAW